jgi:hypothetical protein
MKISLTIHTVLLFFWLPYVGRIHGFVAPITSHRGVCVVTVAPSSHGILSKSCRGAPLKYRELNEDDEMTESATLKVMSRAPPGYNLRENLQKQRNQMSRKKTGMNLPLIRALTLNQFFILGLATVLTAGFIFSTEGASGFSNLNEILQWAGDTNIFDFELTLERLLWGIGGALPLLAFSSLIENSDNRAFSNINFSTITVRSPVEVGTGLRPWHFFKQSQRIVDHHSSFVPDGVDIIRETQCSFYPSSGSEESIPYDKNKRCTSSKLSPVNCYWFLRRIRVSSITTGANCSKTRDQQPNPPISDFVHHFWLRSRPAKK